MHLSFSCIYTLYYPLCRHIYFLHFTLLYVSPGFLHSDVLLCPDHSHFFPCPLIYPFYLVCWSLYIYVFAFSSLSTLAQTIFSCASRHLHVLITKYLMSRFHTPAAHHVVCTCAIYLATWRETPLFHLRTFSLLSVLFPSAAIALSVLQLLYWRT